MSKRKKCERDESFLPKRNFIKEGDPLTVLVWGFYSQTLYKLPKNQNQNLLQGIKWEEKKKGTKEVKMSKSRKGEQCMR